MGTKRVARLVPAVVVALAALVSCNGASSSPPSSPPPVVPASGGTTAVAPEHQMPIVFVHGNLGSGAQYRTVALRFASNGYPASHIRAFDYGTMTIDAPELNDFIDDLLGELDAPTVHLVGHSLGTAAVAQYLAEPDQADRVDKVVLVDGVACPEGDDDCLEIRAGELGQTHVEASTSPESFERQYRFLTGKAPATTEIVPEAPDQVEIAGKALKLQVNTPASVLSGEVWEIDPATGTRVRDTSHATFSLRPDGSFGPIKVNGDKHYEIALRLPDITMHYYHQPFIRSSYLLRLLTVDRDTPTAINTNRNPAHSAVVVTRYREWWRTHGEDNDSLRILLTGEAPVDLLEPVMTDVVGIHIHDDKATPGRSSGALLPFFPGQAFQTGVDVFLPAASPPSGTITIVNVPRGDETKVQSLAAPNWPSSTDVIRFEFDDYVQ